MLRNAHGMVLPQIFSMPRRTRGMVLWQIFSMPRRTRGMLFRNLCSMSFMTRPVFLIPVVPVVPVVSVVTVVPCSARFPAFPVIRLYRAFRSSAFPVIRLRRALCFPAFPGIRPRRALCFSVFPGIRLRRALCFSVFPRIRLRRALCFPGPRNLSGRNKALLSEPDQILAPFAKKGFLHKIIIFRVAILDEGSLHGLFMRVSRNVNRIHRPGIQPRVIHTGRNRPRRGIKILHLLRHITEFTNVLSKLNRVLQPACRGGRTSDREQCTAPSRSSGSSARRGGRTRDRPRCRVSPSLREHCRRHAPAPPAAVR